jgi:hypothetical protein
LTSPRPSPRRRGRQEVPLLLLGEGIRVKYKRDKLENIVLKNVLGIFVQTLIKKQQIKQSEKECNTLIKSKIFFVFTETAAEDLIKFGRCL